MNMIVLILLDDGLYVKNWQYKNFHVYNDIINIYDCIYIADGGIALQ